MIGKYLSIFFVVLLVNFFVVATRVWCLQDEKKPDFEMVVQNGHSNPVTSVSFSPDGKYIVSGSWDKTIKLWNIDGKLVRTFEGHSDWIKSVSFSPDGKHIVSGGWKTINLWTIEGKLIKTFEGHSNDVISVSFSPDGKYIASGSCDKTIKLWNTQDNLIRTFLGHSDEVNSVSFSPDGEYIVSGARDKTIKLWSIDGELVRTFEGHSSWVNSVSFSPDGKYIVSSSADVIIKLWDMEGELIRTSEGHFDWVQSVLFSPDGKYIVSGSLHNIMKFWDIQGKLIRTFKGHSGWVESVSFSPDGKYIASGSFDKTIKLWDMQGSLIKTFEGHSDPVTSVSFGPDGKYIASGSFDKTIKLWNIQRNFIKTFEGYSGRFWSLVRSLYVRTFKGHSGPVTDVSFSPDGKHIASSSRDNTIKLWNIHGKLIRTFSGHSAWVESVSFSPDGKYIASGACDKTIKLWDTQGKLVRTFEGHFNCVDSVSFSPDGKYIASGSGDNTIKLWNIQGNLFRIFEGHSADVKSVSFSLDGKYIVSGAGDGTVRLWNINTGDHFSLISTDNDWIIYTPDGYFDASLHGGEMVAIVKGLDVYGVDQFAVRNNRPDLILERMGLGTPEQISHYNMLYQKRLKKLGLTEAALSSELHAPEAKITGTKQTGKFIDITFSFSDNKYPLKKYNIYVNDVPIFGSAGKEINGNSFKGTEKIELTAGRNKIEISAMNNAGAESYRILTYADYDGKEKGDLYYLAFGASKYKDSKLNLNYADKDVKDMEAVILKMRPAYTDIHVKTFLNADVTSETIKNAKDFLKDAKVDDTVILAISGHGGYDKGHDAKYYYFAYGTDTNNLPGTGVDFDSMEDLLDGIKPRKKLFLMDTCESGELDESTYNQYYAMADARGLKPRTYRKPMKARGSDKVRGYVYEKDRFIYNDLSRRTGAIVFSSSRGGELSYESSHIQNGFFTKEIIYALTSRAADKNMDGKIDSRELRDFVSGAVVNDTSGLQHPTIDRDNLYQKIEIPLVLN